jgi:iron complex outermembrane receptor protein
MGISKAGFMRAASTLVVGSLFVCTGTAQAQATGAASAEQPAASQGLGEIVVTAQRRQQNLQDVGVAVSALNADALREKGVKDSTEIMNAVPGVLLQHTFGGGGTNANLSVRGITQTDTSPNQEPPNAMYIDDVFLSSPAMASFGLYDTERVEVLRGPQGTLFGRASSGGLVNFLSVKPSKDWNGFAEVSYSSFNTASLEAAVGGPLSDRVRFRLAGKIERSDGYLINTAPGGQNAFESDMQALRGQIEADLTDKLTARISVSYEESPKTVQGGYQAQPAYFVPDASSATGALPALLPANVDAYGTGPGNDLAGYRNTDPRFNAVGFNNGNYLQKHRIASSLYLTYALGDATLSSITNYTKFKFNYMEDPDGGPLDLARFNYGQDLDQFSQELRINGKSGPLTYTAGAYYLHSRQTFPQQFVGFLGTPFAFNVLNTGHQALDSWALFGQAEYQFTDKLKLTGGLRYTNETKSFESVDYALDPNNPVVDPSLIFYDFRPSSVGALARNKEGLWSGKIQLDYKPAEHALLYLGVSRGVKGAGFNTNNAGTLTVDLTQFKSEYLYAYEGGAKFDLFDRKLRINASAFYYDYHRFQGFTFFSVTGRAGNYDGYFKGGEIEITARPLPTLDINLGASYLETKLRNVTGTYIIGARDTQAAQAPKWTVNGSVTKRFELPFGTLSFSWDGNYIGDRYASIDNNPASFIKGSFIHDARVGLKLADQGVDLAFFVKNISNTGRLNFSIDSTAFFGNWLRIYSPPRWIGGSIRKTF